MLDTINFIPEDYTFTAGDPVIPRILHMIWVGDAARPAYVDQYIQQWKTLMPTWQIRLWTNTDISEDEFPATIVAKLNACEKGAQKADIMRYFIIHKYGGVYLDTDVIPYRSLDPLIEWGKPVILCHDLPLTWQYISVGFFAAIPSAPLFEYACRLCETATINTPDVHMHTGPRLLGEAVWNTKEPMQLLHCYYFYRNQVGQEQLNGSIVTHDFTGRFGSHFYAKMW
jgi:mannosyltransferase OCH1-like enzyme